MSRLSLVGRIIGRMHDSHMDIERLLHDCREEIERLQEIERAAKNLVTVKGRHHSEFAYKQLEELLK